LNQSTKLLCNTDKSISDIAFDVGFHGASYYSETFRKWFGISPTKEMLVQYLFLMVLVLQETQQKKIFFLFLLHY